MVEFVAYLDERGVDRVTSEHALGWARLPNTVMKLSSPMTLTPRGQSSTAM